MVALSLRIRLAKCKYYDITIYDVQIPYNVQMRKPFIK